MEVVKLSPGIVPAIANVKVAKGQVDIKDVLKNKLAELTKMLANRKELIDSLPDNIKQLVMELLQSSSAEENVQKGMAFLLKMQKGTADNLKNLVSILQDAELLLNNNDEEIQKFINSVAQNLSTRTDKKPEQLTSELLRLTQESNDAILMSKSNDKQINQLLQQILPDKVSEQDQQVLTKLSKSFTEAMPKELVKLLEGADDKQTKETYTVLKTAIAVAFKDIDTKDLKLANQVLENLTQLLSQSEDITDAPEKLANIIKALPEKVAKELATLKQGVPEKLMLLAEAIKSAITLKNSSANILNSQDNKEINEFLENIYQNTKDIPVFELTAKVEQLAKQFTNQQGLANKLKDMVKNLSEQLISGEFSELSKEETAIVEKISLIFEESVPPAMKEVAEKLKLPELPKLLVLLKAVSAKEYTGIEKQNLPKSAEIIKEVAQSIYKPSDMQSEKQTDHSILSFSLPLMFGEGKIYPAYIHIYQQEKENSNDINNNFETWLRICMETDNIGIVDSVFRVYDDNNLDIRVNFSDMQAAADFSNKIVEIRKSMENNKLKLTDIIINKN